MKSMSQVARIEDCPETLEEARVLLAQQSASIKAKWQRSKELSAQLAAVTKERNELKEDNDHRRTEMGNVWDMVQKISPWQESNDMNWSDEISCGLHGIEEQLTVALARAEKAEEDTRRLDWLEHDMIRLLQYSEPDSDGSNYQIEYFSRPGRKTVQSTSIRAAIDAALTPTKEPTP